MKSSLSQGWAVSPKSLKKSFLCICSAILLDAIAVTGKLIDTVAIDPSLLRGNSLLSVAVAGLISGAAVVLISYNSLVGNKWARNILTIFGVILFIMFLRLNLGIPLTRTFTWLNLLTWAGQFLFLAGIFFMFTPQSREFFIKKT